MRTGLLKCIRESKNITNAVILTHNIDFIFLQTVVLSGLRRCGHPRLTIFADAQCALNTYAQQAPLLDSLGSRFRVVPVAMEPGFRFHPKALLLSGQEKATLFVGSGNLTFGGWRENGEVWTRFDSDTDGPSSLYAFRDYLNLITKVTPLRDAIVAEVEEAFDDKTRAWAASPAEPRGLLPRMKTGNDLITQMKQVIGEKQVKRLTICAPYYDDGGLALRRIVDVFKPTETVLLVQPGRSTLRKSTADKLPKGASISTVDFIRKDLNESQRSSFIHAKFYAMEWDDKVTVFAGSANCSQAALTIPGAAGNAELLTHEELSRAAFKEAFLGELVIVKTDPKLSDGEEEAEETDRLPSLHILAARHGGTTLKLAFQAPADCEIKKCLVDGEPRDYTVPAASHLEVAIPAPPHRVQLEAQIGGQAISSNIMWVDDERALLSSAWSRSVDNEIRDRVRDGCWDISAWTRIMEVFCKHLQYMPRSSQGTARVAAPRRDASRLPTFNAEDIYAEGYGLPALDMMSLALGATSRTSSLQQTLLRWFGLPATDVLPEADGPEIDDEGDESSGSEPGTDKVDTPEKLRSAKKVQERKAPTAGDRKRALQILEQVRAALTSNEYLSARSANALSADIKIASALFQTALREKWITPEVYCEASAAIWAALFISCGGEKAVGWIEHRYQTAEDPDAFAESFASLQLTVALATWALAVPSQKNSFGYSLFAMASAYAVARLPWLWNTGEPQAIALEMAQLLRDTGALTLEDQDAWQQASNGWRSLIQRGTALHDFEIAAAGFTASQLSEAIKQPSIQAGELLWQGENGFVVAERAGSRHAGNAIAGRHFVTNKTRKYAAQFVVPIAGLLNCPLIKISPSAGKALREFLAELS